MQAQRQGKEQMWRSIGNFLQPIFYKTQIVFYKLSNVGVYVTK